MPVVVAIARPFCALDHTVRVAAALSAHKQKLPKFPHQNWKHRRTERSQKLPRPF